MIRVNFRIILDGQVTENMFRTYKPWCHKPNTMEPLIYLEFGLQPVPIRGLPSPPLDLEHVSSSVLVLQVLRGSQAPEHCGSVDTVCTGSSDQFYIASILYKMGRYYGFKLFLAST